MKGKIINFLERLRVHFKDESKTIDFRDLEIPYVAKGSQDSAIDAAIFGGTIERYKFWRPHMCAVCCLKMVGDAAGKTNDMTLSRLVDVCLEKGVFRVEHNDVFGAFHRPLVRVMNKLGIPARKVGNVSTEDMVREIGNGKIIFLSIDLAKLPNSSWDESHLVVVYDVIISPKREFRLHDCSSVLSENGNAMSMSEEELSRLSNMRGLIVG